MSTAVSERGSGHLEGFRHEALFHSGDGEFLAGAIPFIRGGLEAGSPVALRGHLDSDADGVHFAEMEQVGRNPARIIPVWRDFLSEHGDGHAELRAIGEPQPSAEYGVGEADRPFDGVLDEPPDGDGRRRFDAELATNSVRHAEGLGVLRTWDTPDTLVCEVRDDGRIRDPLVGRARPREGQADGVGLWLVNQVCDLVQVRSSGSVVRLHMRRA